MRHPIYDGEGRAQCFMTVHDLAHALLQGRNVQLPLQTQRRWHVVGRTLTLQLLKEPDPLLGKRERQITITPNRLYRIRLIFICAG